MSLDYNPNHIRKKTFAIVGGKAVVFNNSGKILIMKRSDKSTLGGKWSLPGGALEDGENPYDGIKREISEETKVSVSDLKPFFVKSSKNSNRENVIIIGYTCKANSENIVLNWEHDRYMWVNKDEGLSLNLTTDGRSFLEKLP